MRRGAELLTLLLLAFGGCEGEPGGPIDVRVDFKVTGSEGVTAFEVDCDPAGEPSAVCAEIASAPNLYFPEEGLECPLPVGLPYLMIRGTYGDEELRRMMTPCTEGETRAVDAWAALLGFEPPDLR
jgi:hypothetical protein